MTWLRSEYSPIDTDTFHFFGTPKVRKHDSPVTLFFKDVFNIGVNFKLTFVVLATFFTERSIDELYLWAPTVFSLMWFTFWSIIQIPLVLAVLGTFMVIAGVLSALTTVHSFFLWRIIQGPQLQVYPPTPPQGYNERHRWIYLNGIATGKTITKQNLECLSQTFHNPVLAINNRTYGFMGDLLECVIQRAFGFHTKETATAYDIIRSYLEDHKNVDKVILIAHSQGGILAAQILDQLYCSLSQDELRKLEVYTFGSAARQFNNPWKDGSKTARVVPVMEHYCNERDMVTSWGALSSVDREEIPFQGRVFVSHAQTGHMLNQHYLKYMFTGPPHTWMPDHFLLRAVCPDTKIPDKYHVQHSKADPRSGQPSVQSLSNLWRYL